MKIRLKLSPSRIPAILLVVALAAVAWGSFRFYRLINDYAAVKNKPENQTAAIKLPPPPSFHIFTPDDPIKYALFTFNRRDLLPPPDPSAQAEAPPNYAILGVVKQKQLFLVVRSAVDNKVRLIPPGGSINGEHAVAAIHPGWVELTDLSGRRWTHKLFKMINIEEIQYEQKEDSPNGP